jgi:hypothetical protein
MSKPPSGATGATGISGATEPLKAYAFLANSVLSAPGSILCKTNKKNNGGSR